MAKKRTTPAIPELKEYEKKEVKESKNKSKSQVVIGEQSYINSESGEIENFLVIQKNINKDYNFHKIWLEDLLNILNTMGNRKMTILSYLLSIMRNSDNTLNFTMRSLSEDTGVSLQTCQSTITELLESNVIKRDRRIKQLYTFNPSLLVKGNGDKRKRLLVEYHFEDEQKDISNKLESFEKLSAPAKELEEEYKEIRKNDYIDIKDINK